MATIGMKKNVLFQHNEIVITCEKNMVDVKNYQKSSNPCKTRKIKLIETSVKHHLQPLPQNKISKKDVPLEP
jgi:hypothetical protein